MVYTKKRNYGKKKTYNKKRYQKKMPSYKSNKLMSAAKNRITFLPSSKLNKCLPDSYHTRFTCENDGRYAPGVTVGEITVLANSIYYPFDDGQLINGYSLSNPAITISQLTPTGLYYLLPPNGAGPYSKFTVISSTIYITVRLDTSDDIVEVVVCPLTNGSAIDLATISSTELAQQPDAKKMIVTNQKSGYMVKSQKMYTYLGVPKKALMDDLSGNFDGRFDQSPSQIIYWGIKFTSKDGEALQGNMTINIKVQYNTKLWYDLTGLYPSQVTPPT